MLSKEEYLTHLEYGVKTGPTIHDAFKELIEKYFEIEAKQTPQKVICINKHGEDIDYKNVDLLKCSNCGRRLRNKQHDPYCPKCGQKLDWSETNEETGLY